MDINQFIETGVAEGWLRKTNNSDRKFIYGQDQDCPIYEVRIDKLHYNKQNGRIATYISRYKADHPEGLPSDQAALDKLIQDMIDAENPKRLRTTMLDIKAKGQQQPAIVLSNGVVIDGNRRFTCLRKLSAEEGGIPRTMRCFVFPDTYDDKAIKGLELEIQMGEDTKQDYDAISRLVDIDWWVNGGNMTAEEYARHANIKSSEMKSMLEQIQIMKEFLEFVEAPGAFYIAQDLKLQGPIESLANRLKKCKNADDREDIKNIIFANLVMTTLGDRTRSVRDMIDNLIEDERFREEQSELAVEVLEKFEDLPEGTKVTTEFLRDHIASDKDLKGEVKASQEKARTKAGNRKVKNGQVRAVRDAVSNLDGVDVDLLHKLEPEQLLDMQAGLNELLQRAEELSQAIQKVQEA